MSTRPARASAPARAAEIRQSFLDFFAERGHRIVPSSPVFPQDDPTLLFTNAGMNQFKDVFLGTGKREYTRAADTQKCIRVSGKHNDLEEVGVDHYHHTFFEMLGNWSFGDYFKKDAIAWSWELLTKVWGLPPERLWVTVFGGDEKDGLPADQESEHLWLAAPGVDPSRVLRFGRKANFWEMGETGPCGPCTEIHFDTGGPETDASDGADPKIGVNSPSPRFLELWNNVFMEFNRLDDGSLRKLPAQHVDTGMGLERIVRVRQGASSNYDTDLFTPILARLGEIAGRRYAGSAEPADVAFRVAADHVRAITAAVSDGASPSNVGRGYVLRRLVRRAARYGRQELGLEAPFLHDLVPVVAEVLGAAFPEMRARVEHVRHVLKEEEASFARTLGRGLVRFGDLAGRIGKSSVTVIPGAEAFELYATYGFPVDLVELMARERGLALDRDGWEAAEKAHQAASRSEGKFKQILSAEQLEGLPPTRSTYHDAGADALELATEVAALFRGGERDVLVLVASPFYPEGGGQIGDAGRIVAEPSSGPGAFHFEVEDVRRMGPVVVHLGRAKGEVAPGARVRARADGARRDRTRKNHTATHLLHKALRDVLGPHVNQQGSYVGPDRLRFDFSHAKGLTQDEIEEIERRVNAEVAANAVLTTTVEDLDAAKARGVVALFGEKYESRVRVVQCGASVELCGGTHVRAAGDIGAFAITLERAIQAGVRRIEALTGPSAIEEFQRQRRVLAAAARALSAPEDKLVERIGELQAKVKEAKKKGEQGAKADVDAALGRVKAALATAGGVRAAVVDLPELDLAALRDLGSRAKALAPDLCLALFGREQGRVPFLILCQGAALARGLDAGVLAATVKGLLGGGGGGKPDAAQGQGLDATAVPRAIEALRAALGERAAR